MKKAEKLETKIRSIKVPLYKNPGPSEMRDLWMEAKAKNLGDPNHCKFMIDKQDNLYVWGGDRGLHRFVVKSLGMKLNDFSAFGVFRTEPDDPRKMASLEYISKNSFQFVTNDPLQKKFLRIIHSLRLKKSPSFQNYTQTTEEES